MAGSSRQSLPSWITAAAAATTTRVDIEGINNSSEEGSPKYEESKTVPSASDFDLGFAERAFAAAGAAVLSAIIVNPLDVAKTRLQAQAAGVPYKAPCGTVCFESNTMFPYVKGSPHAVPGSQQLCASECNRYKGAMDVFYKVIRQEGIGRLWRGTSASLALAVPTVGIYMPCYDIFRNSMEEFTTQNCPAWTPYVPLVAGAVARTLSCITCYPVELARTRMQAFKETHAGVKPSGVWKTLIECKATASFGLDLEHSLLAMSPTLQSAGQPLSLPGDKFLPTWVMKLGHLVSLGQTFLLASSLEPLQQLLHVHLMSQRPEGR